MCELGFPIKLTTTTTTGEGNKSESVSSSQEVTALEVAQLDTALFDVPKDYVEASSTAEIVPSMAKGGSSAEALFGSTADGTSTAAPKKPGTIRIGVLQPVNKVARDLPRPGCARIWSRSSSPAMRRFRSPAVRRAAVEADAVRLQCDYVMLTEIIEAKTSKPGKFGGLIEDDRRRAAEGLARRQGRLQAVRGGARRRRKPAATSRHRMAASALGRRCASRRSRVRCT